MEEVSVIRTLNQSVSHTGKSPATSTTKSVRSETSGAPVATVVDVVAGNVRSEKKVELAEVSAAVEDLNQRLALANNTLRFQIDDTTEEIKVQVVDKDTGKVVRTIPPEPSLSILSQGEFSGLLSVQG
jgi:uncharacterized FlaG/YvyC family protein